MRNDDPGSGGQSPEVVVSSRVADLETSEAEAEAAGWIVETIISPFHCLYQDALEFHKQSHLRLPRSVAEASRLARAAFLLYLEAADALVNQAAAELARPDLRALIFDSANTASPLSAWALLPLVVGEGAPQAFDPMRPPWAQLAELFELRASWRKPGGALERRAFYRSSRRDASYEPLEPHQIPAGLDVDPARLLQPRTGLPTDPYALRPKHVDTARSVLDQAIEALDKRLAGMLTKDGRHRREPVRLLE